MDDNLRTATREYVAAENGLALIGQGIIERGAMTLVDREQFDQAMRLVEEKRTAYQSAVTAWFGA
jgi:hypothetical protein